MITVVVPVSPIPSHPETRIIEETVASVRHHLPYSEIMPCFDGVRPEQEHRRQDYEESIRRTLWLAKSWGAIVPYLSDSHLHQVGMLRAVIDEIRTPLMLFVEQDTPLLVDAPIDWPACIGLIQSGTADVVRFSHEASVLPEHQHLARERRGEFLRTLQWSARPHVASVAYYRRVLAENFSPEACTYTEDVLHGAAQDEPDKHKVWLYHPGGNIKRSRHLDGRAGDPKFDDKLVF